ncbi:MAG: cyclic nucleotide-binding domain-containing protein [Proteobacteria bacterium]|nr:cyclic nucleotide-binding domain-containing protein [Pseudomonadota bacterium]
MQISLSVPDLSPRDADDLLARAAIRSFPRHAVVINEGDDSNSVYFIMSGAVRVFLSDKDGNEVVIGTLRSGEYFGEMALEPGSRSASVMATEPLKLACVGMDDFRNFLKKHPDFMYSVLCKLIRRVRTVNRNIKGLALLDVYGRLVQLLQDLAVPSGSELLIDEPLTQQELASRIGCSREMVSKIMKDLVDGGYLEVSRKHIAIKRRLPASW